MSEISNAVLSVIWIITSDLFNLSNSLTQDLQYTKTAASSKSRKHRGWTKVWVCLFDLFLHGLLAYIFCNIGRQLQLSVHESVNFPLGMNKISI